MEPIKLNEKSRIYTFMKDGYCHDLPFENVTELIVSESGNHRIKAEGKLHIIPPTWICISIDSNE